MDEHIPEAAQPPTPSSAHAGALPPLAAALHATIGLSSDEMTTVLRVSERTLRLYYAVEDVLRAPPGEQDWVARWVAALLHAEHGPALAARFARACAAWQAAGREQEGGVDAAR